MRPEIANTPLPIWMKNLKRDNRGYPIPFIVLTTKDGKAHFTVNDESRRQHVIKHDLCGICGRRLVRNRALIGGPVSAFLDQGAYIDPPMHIECAQYALQVCPWLAVRNYEGGKFKAKEQMQLYEDAKGEGIILSDPTAMPDKPKFFVMVVHRGRDYVHYDAEKRIVQYIKPHKPYVRVEYWKDGKQIEEQEGEAEAKASLLRELTAQYPNAERAIQEANVQALLEQKS